MTKRYVDYTDHRDATTKAVVLVYDGHADPYHLRHLIVHSPTGIGWGYGGSGPADLALAILADYLGEAAAIPPHDDYDPAVARHIERTRAWALHQHFKWDIVARLEQERGFTLEGRLIESWLSAQAAR